MKRSIPETIVASSTEPEAILPSVTVMIKAEGREESSNVDWIEEQVTTELEVPSDSVSGDSAQVETSDMIVDMGQETSQGEEFYSGETEHFGDSEDINEDDDGDEDIKILSEDIANPSSSNARTTTGER